MSRKKHLITFFTLWLAAIIVTPLSGQVAAYYFENAAVNPISSTCTACGLTTFTVDETCETIRLSVTDPENAPLSASNPYVITVRDTDGNRVTDLTDNVNVTIRVRTPREPVVVSTLFRSGGGSATERSAVLSFTVPADSTIWTEFTLTYEAGDLGGFVPSDLRDFWFYLDRGTPNFAGNEVYIDHIVIGGTSDASRNSTCPLDGGSGNNTPIYTEQFVADTLESINLNNTAASRATFVVDAECETLSISVTDPMGDPLPAFNAFQVEPRDANGDRITDVTGKVNVSMRVRSREAINISALWRGGDGTADFRTGRKDIDIPGDTTQWTEFTLSWEDTELGGFDPADFRDLWFYLDRGDENFAGNDLLIDYIVIGGAPDATLNSTCPLVDDGTDDGPLYTEQFVADTLGSINQTNAAARRATFVVDAECETLSISVTDLMGDPLPAFNAFQVEPRDVNGDRITDVTGKVNVSMRVRSREAINISALWRGGDGTADFRTGRKDIDIPGDTTQWTEFTLSWEDTELGGFDPADFRDLWFYLDRGDENFAGNDLLIDYIVIGGAPDPALNSTCPLPQPTNNMPYFEYFAGDNIPGNISQTNAAGRRLTFLPDTECSSLNITVTDPTGDPLPPFNAIQINPFDVNGMEISDLTDNINVTMRVRTVEGINISVLFRSGGGTMDERTLRKDIDVPGGLTEWTEFTLTWETADLDGFVPTDFLDMWIYLDRGEENFAGNYLDIDHVVIGATPDAALNSDCSQEEVPDNFIEQFTAASSTNVFAGGEARKLTLAVTDCEELSVSVTDTMGAPYQAFRPIVIDPVNANGVSISNIEGLVTVYIRARAAAAVPISVLLRSGDGSVDFRTATLTQTVRGDLNGWSNLIYTFSEDDLAGFEPTDLLDLWIYLDRESNNFPGNELYFDYISLGEQPNTMTNSSCGLPDVFTTGTEEASWGSELLLYPNPTTYEVWLELPINSLPGSVVRARMFNSLGQEVRLQTTEIRSERTRISLSDQPSGTYYLLLTDQGGNLLSRSIIKH